MHAAGVVWLNLNVAVTMFELNGGAMRHGGQDSTFQSSAHEKRAF